MTDMPKNDQPSEVQEPNNSAGFAGRVGRSEPMSFADRGARMSEIHNGLSEALEAARNGGPPLTRMTSKSL